jgi:sulfur carrier protein
LSVRNDMQILVNGLPETVSDSITAAQLLDHLKIARERVAVVVNENVVRRAELSGVQLKDGDSVEIITMVGGG